MQYLVHEKWGGKVYDVKKSPGNPDDDLMCWAAAASNVLAWTGWGFPAQGAFVDENAIFSYFLDHWADVPGYSQLGWEWWFNGRPQSGVEQPGGGFWDPPHAFGQHYRAEWVRTETLVAISNNVTQGCGMVMDLMAQQGTAHVLTCWGCEQREDGTYLGIYATDADDPTSGLRCYPVYQDKSGQEEWAQYQDWWYLTYRVGAPRYLITAVHALKRRIQAAPQPPSNLRVS